MNVFLFLLAINVAALDGYYSGVVWSTNAVNGIVTGARQYPGKANLVEVLIKEAKPQSKAPVFTDLWYMRKSVSGDFRLFSTENVEIKRTPVCEHYAKVATKTALDHWNRPSFMQIVFHDPRGVHLFDLPLNELFVLPEKGDYSLRIAPEVWRVADGKSAIPIKLPIIAIPVTLNASRR